MLILGNTWTARRFDILTESYHDKQVNKAAEYIQQNHANLIGLEKTLAGNPKTAKDLANDVVHYIPFLIEQRPGSKRGKFIYGAARIFYDELDYNHRDVKDALGKLIRTLVVDGHEADYNEDLNGLSFDELRSQFGSTAKQLSKNEREYFSNRSWTKNNNYKIVQIRNTKEAEKYQKYLNPSNVWCITTGQDFYNNYAGDFGVFYFVLKNGFENVERVRGPNHPHDEYGESMMAVCVDGDGDFVNCTSRWNGSGDFHTPEELSNILGGNFYELFPPIPRIEQYNNIKNGGSTIPISDVIEYIKSHSVGQPLLSMLKEGLKLGCEIINKSILDEIDETDEPKGDYKWPDKMYGFANNEIIIYDYKWSFFSYILCNGDTGKLISSESLKELGAFDLPYSITKLEIPSETKKIDVSNLGAYQSLKEITISPENNNFYIKNGLIIDKATGCIITTAFRQATNITIPDGLIQIGRYAFAGMPQLAVIKIPNTIKSIGDRAFAGCNNLKSICIPGSVTEIPYDMCHGCSSLEQITIENGVRKINNEAFCWNSSLTEITIPESVFKIGRNVFSSCYNLKTIILKSNSVDFDKNSFELSMVKKIIIPDDYNIKTLEKVFNGVDDFKTKVITASGKNIKIGNRVNRVKRQWYSEDDDDDDSEYDNWYESLNRGINATATISFNKCQRQGTKSMKTKKTPENKNFTSLIESWGTPWQRITSQLID